jgi:hypothetical protein
LIPKAQVVLVLWDHYYTTNSDAVTAAKQLITDLVSGPFINGLTQYGIHRGSLINTIVIDTNNSPSPKNPAPKVWDIGDGNDATQVLAWINNGTLSPQPQSSPQGVLLYFIFMPTATQLTAGKNSDGTPNTNVCGWHHSGNLSDPNSTPVFWAVVRTDQAPQTKGQAFVSQFAYCVGHELAEALTDPKGGSGFGASNGCEIGDICELHTFTYRGWSIEQYWSNWDAACINGDQPVSVRKFLAAIGYSGSNGLRGLPGLSGSPYNDKLNLDYIADRMFPRSGG